MSVSVYYSCTRNIPLSESEEKDISELVNYHNNRFEWKDTAEVLTIYQNEHKENIVFEGSVKLPYEGDEAVMIDALFYWLHALSDIRKTIQGGEWQVQMDDVEIPWSESQGFHMVV